MWVKKTDKMQFGVLIKHYFFLCTLDDTSLQICKCAILLY